MILDDITELKVHTNKFLGNNLSDKRFGPLLVIEVIPECEIDDMMGNLYRALVRKRFLNEQEDDPLYLVCSMR